MLGALFAACTNDEIVEEPQQGEAAEVVHFTATLAPKSEGSSRAITTGKDGNNKEILNVSWKEDEEIAIYYETETNGVSGWATTTAEVQSVDSETHAATISATLSNPKPNGQAKFVYPATLHNGEGGIDESQLLNNQNGLLRTSATNISKNFDAATGTGTIIVNGNEANVEGNVGMKNEVCILKIKLFFLDGGNYVDGGKTLNIAVGDGRTYTISSPFQPDNAIGENYLPFQSGNIIYVAMLPFTSQSIVFSSTNANGTYGFATTGSLEAGKFYRNVPITMRPDGGELIDLRDGSVTVSNDCVVTSGGESTDNTITIPDGYTVTLRNVNISTDLVPITCLGDATIILEGTNSVVCDGDAPGIQAGPSGSTLTIRGSGSLTATGGENAAGIGSGFNDVCGGINITGGIITAYGGENAAGIGCGKGGACYDITITSDVTSVTAEKGNNAPYSIGLGYGSPAGGCLRITIGGRTYGNQGISTSPFTYQP